MLGIPGNRDCLLTAYKSEDWAPLCKKFASDTKIYIERPPDGVLVPLPLTLRLPLFSDESWHFMGRAVQGRPWAQKSHKDDFIGSAWLDSQLVNAGAAVSDWARSGMHASPYGGSNDWGLIRPSMHWDLTRWEQRLRTYPPQHALGPDSGFIAPAQHVGAGFIADFLLLGCLGDPASGGGRLCSCGTIFA